MKCFPLNVFAHLFSLSVHQVYEPIAGNYYPLTAAMYIQDTTHDQQLAVLTDRSQGGASLKSGEMEVRISSYFLCTVFVMMKRLRSLDHAKVRSQLFSNCFFVLAAGIKVSFFNQNSICSAPDSPSLGDGRQPWRRRSSE